MIQLRWNRCCSSRSFSYSASSFFKYILFADDTSLLNSLNIAMPFESKMTSDIINVELTKIFDWLAVNKLSLNVKKTKFMIFHYHNKDISQNIPNLIINDIEIERVTNFNFLGLTINENISWKPHINKIVSKISKHTGIMNRLKSFSVSSCVFYIVA